MIDFNVFLIPRKFAFALKGISVVLMLHINILVLYQSKWLQDILWEEDFLTRSFCLSKIYTTSGRKKNILRFNEDLNWDQYLNPLVLIVTYFMITITSNFILVWFHFCMSILCLIFFKFQTSDIEIGRFSQRKGPAGSANVKSKFALMARKLVEMQNRHEKLSEENIVREKKYKIYLKFIIKNAGIMLYRSNYLITNVIMMVSSFYCKIC